MRNDVPKSVLQTVKKSNKTTDEEDVEGFTMIFDQQSGFHTAKESTPDNDLDTSALMDRIQLLENKLNDALTQSAVPAIKVHDIQFFSSTDAKIWSKAHLTGYRFGLFLDGVSIWEHFSINYQSLNEVINSFRDAARIGFATLHEGKVATSFQNVMPALLGKGVDTSMFLPGLTSYNKWDNNDGSSGLRYHITREMSKVNTQISQSIRNTFADHFSPARALAMECLQKSIQFVSELSAYITRFHSELISSGSFSSEQCWSLVSRCVKRCFQDLAEVRVTARDVKNAENVLSTAAEYL